MELKAAACTWQIICLVLFIAHPTESIDCYICGPGADSAFQTAAASASSSETVPESRSCDEFDESQDKTTFVMTCPNNYRGCITQIEGSIIKRTCEALNMSSCGTMTNSRYCLCNTDLCNSDPISPVAVPPFLPDSGTYDEERNYGEGDDEDYVETGSGQGHASTDLTTKGPTGSPNRIESTGSTTTSDIWLLEAATTKRLEEDILISPKTSGSHHSLSYRSLIAILLLARQFLFI